MPGLREGDPGAGGVGRNGTAPAWLRPQAGERGDPPTLCLHPTYPVMPRAVLSAHAASRWPSGPARRLPGQHPRALPRDRDPLSYLQRAATRREHVCAHQCLQPTHAPRLLASFITSIKDEKSHSWAGSQSQTVFFFLFLTHSPPAGAGVGLPGTPWHPRPRVAASEGPWPLCPMGMGRVGTSPVPQQGRGRAPPRSPQAHEGLATVVPCWGQLGRGAPCSPWPMHHPKAAPAAIPEPGQRWALLALPAPHAPTTSDLVSF